MVRRIVSLGAAVAALAACQPSQSPKGQPIAKGKDIVITAEDFKARLDEQSPFIRARYSSLERKKEFLDNLIRFEVLAREAERQGLANDPDVRQTMKKVMVQKLVQKNFQDPEGAKAIPEEDLQKYYDEHKDDYYRPKRVRLAAVVLNAPEGSPERAAKLAIARKTAAKLKAEEKTNALAFAQAVNQVSEDAASKSLAGDLGFKSQAELEGAYGPRFADAAFGLQSGQVSGVIETTNALYLLKATGVQQELNRPFDQVKMQIANRLFRERKSKEFDAWQKKLRDEAGVTVDEKALEAIAVAPAPAGAPGMPPGHAPVGGPRVLPAPAPAPSASEGSPQPK